MHQLSNWFKFVMAVVALHEGVSLVAAQGKNLFGCPDGQIFALCLDKKDESKVSANAGGTVKVVAPDGSTNRGFDCTTVFPDSKTQLETKCCKSNVVASANQPPGGFTEVSAKLVKMSCGPSQPKAAKG